MTADTSRFDLLPGLGGGGAFTSPARQDALRYTRDAYIALYERPQVLAASTLHALAAIVARRQGSAVLAEHHAEPADPALLGEALPDAPKLRTLVEHVDLITVSPARVERDDQLTLELAGITPDEIVLVSQVVAYTSYLVRVLHALDLLAGVPIGRAAPLERPTVAHGRPESTVPLTARGSEIPSAFTRDVLAWEPWVAPIPVEELTDEQRESFAAKSAAGSDYFRLLARVPAALRARSALDNAVFLGRDGLPRGERELAATVASRVNDCVYCASVHSRKAEFQTKRTDDVDRLLAAPLARDADWVVTDTSPLSEGQDERWAAIIRFAARLSELVPRADRSDVDGLRSAGLSDAEVADAALATAFFAWANRLMLTLGEPAIP